MIAGGRRSHGGPHVASRQPEQTLGRAVRRRQPRPVEAWCTARSSWPRPRSARDVKNGVDGRGHVRGRRLPRRPGRHPALDRRGLRPGGPRPAPRLGVPDRGRRATCSSPWSSRWSARRRSARSAHRSARSGPARRRPRSSSTRGRRMPTTADQRPDASVARVAGPWEHRMVAANGARFHVAVVGRRTARPVPARLPASSGGPGATSSRRSAAAGYRAAAMDLRGYGASDKPPRGYDPSTLAADVAGVIRSLGARDAVVVGHGLGRAGRLDARGRRTPGRYAASSPCRWPIPGGCACAHLTDPQPAQGQPAHPRASSGRSCRSASLVADDGAAWSATCCSCGPGRAGPTRRPRQRYRQMVQIPGVAHCALESYRWALRSLPRPDGLRYARRMRTPVAVPTLHVHGALADRCCPAARRARAGTSTRPTGGACCPVSGTSRTRRTPSRSTHGADRLARRPGAGPDEHRRRRRPRPRPQRPGPQRPPPRRPRPPAAARGDRRRTGPRRPGAAAAGVAGGGAAAARRRAALPRARGPGGHLEGRAARRARPLAGPRAARGRHDPPAPRQPSRRGRPCLRRGAARITPYAEDPRTGSTSRGWSPARSRSPPDPARRRRAAADRLAAPNMA